MHGSLSEGELKGSASMGLLHKVSSATELGIEEMYKIATRQNTVWGVSGYEVPREYLDPIKMKEKRENKTWKGPEKTKRGHYLEDDMKLHRGKPGPIYDIVKPWFDEKKKKAPVKYGDKKSYIDEIFRVPKEKRDPGPGAYNLVKTDKEIEEMKKKMRSQKHGTSDRLNFLCEVEFMSNTIPGPGNYNPRIPLPPIRQSKMRPEDWKKKHAASAKSLSRAKIDIKTLENPIPVTFNTFGKLLKLKEDKIQPKKINYFGTGERFSKAKKEDPNNFPGAGTYNMVAQWKGKGEPGKKVEKKETHWMQKITKGTESCRSIYY
jgi:hypothetical protein